MRLNREFIQSVIPTVQFFGNPVPAEIEITIDADDFGDKKAFMAFKDKDNEFDNTNEVLKALDNGVSCLIISHEQKNLLEASNPNFGKKVSVIVVPDVKKALVDLAAAWRAQLSCQIVGFTGSVGKTSTIEAFNNILELSGLPFISFEIIENQHINACIAVLNIKPEVKVAVFEMSVTKRGDMAKMADVIRPTSAVITAIGHSNMEGLGSILDIANEKKDIFKFFKESNIGIINGDQTILSNISYKHPTVKFGCKTTNQVQARKIQTGNANTHFVLKFYKDRYKISLNTNHIGGVMNSLAAAAAAYLVGVPNDIIMEGIQKPISINGRFEHKKLNFDKGLLINDCYSATPESMKAALLAFEKFESKGQKIAVLGDMQELGVNSPFWHRQLGRFLRKVSSLNQVILVGEMVQWTKDTVPVGLNFEHFNDWKTAADYLKIKLDKEAVILVKGSQKLQLNNLIAELSNSTN